MPKFLDVTDNAAARTALGDTAIRVSNFVAGAASYQAAIEAAIAIAADRPNGVVDFEGISYVTTGTVTVTDNGVTLQNGGIRPTGQFPAMLVSASDVTVKDMTFSRSTSASVLDNGTARSCVVVEGENFHSYDCDYLGANQYLILLQGGLCDGAVIKGGEITGNTGRQQAAAIYAGWSTAGNRNITIDGVYMHDCYNGVLFYDTGDSLVTNCRVEGLRKLPDVTLTGWTNVSGDVWRQRSASGTPGVDGVVNDRNDGGTTTIFRNGSQFTTPGDGTTPAANDATLDGGYVYINLNGDNPNSDTIVSGVVSGYAYMVYSLYDRAFCSRNRFINNRADDIDGFGIYLQLGDSDEPSGNQAIGNILTNVCLEGPQNTSLAFSGLRVSSGVDTLLLNNLIDGVGSTSVKKGPGIRIDWFTTNTGTPSGQCIGNTVRNGYSHGFDIRSGNWQVSDCVASNNAQDGFILTGTQTGTTNKNVSFLNCRSDANVGNGFSLDGSGAAVTLISGSIIGGSATENTGRGVYIASKAGSSSVTDCLVSGVRLANNLTGASAQIVGMCSRVTFNDCHVSHTSTATGISVSSTAIDAALIDNQYNISTPEALNGNYVRIGGGKSVGMWRGSSSPESVVTGSPGSVFYRTDGANSTSVYIKQSGTSSTGWSAVADSLIQSQSLRANCAVIPSGNITVDASGYLLFDYLTIPHQGRGTGFATAGLWFVECPTSGTIAGVGGASNATATAAGIPLTGWQHLYYILPIGSGSASVPANFRIVQHTADLEIPHTWVLICSRHNSTGVYSLCNGYNLKASQTLNAAYQDTANTANTLVRRDASGNFTAGAITTSGSVELGHASDTTIARSAAGVAAVEGNPLSVRVTVPGTSTTAGKPGFWAADASYIYTYTGDGSTHTWVRATAATW